MKIEGKELEKRAALLDRWKISGAKLMKDFEFDDFNAAMKFANKVGALAEMEDHHPEIHMGHNKVGIELSTHSEGGITDKDFALAEKIDNIA